MCDVSARHRRRLSRDSTALAHSSGARAPLARADLDGARIELTEADTLTVAQTVRAGESVVGFTDGPAAPLGLSSELVASETIVPVVGRDHPWYGRRRSISGRALAASLYLGALPISGATLLWDWGIRRGRVTVAGLLSFLTPLLATAGVVVLLGAPLRAGTIVGGLLILGGAALGLKRDDPATEPETRGTSEPLPGPSSP